MKKVLLRFDGLWMLLKDCNVIHVALKDDLHLDWFNVGRPSGRQVLIVSNLYLTLLRILSSGLRIRVPLGIVEILRSRFVVI